MIKVKFYHSGKLLRGEAHSKTQLDAIIAHLRTTSVTHVFISNNGRKETITLPKHQKRKVQTGFVCSCGARHYIVPISPLHKVVSEFKYF